MAKELKRSICGIWGLIYNAITDFLFSTNSLAPNQSELWVKRNCKVKCHSLIESLVFSSYKTTSKGYLNSVIERSLSTVSAGLALCTGKVENRLLGISKSWLTCSLV